MAFHFPVEVTLGQSKIHVHYIVESLAYAVGFPTMLRLRARKGDSVRPLERLCLSSAAIFGAAVGSILLAHLEAATWTWRGGKTIVGGLVGGLIAVEIAKKMMGVTRSTGDLFVWPIAVGTIIGRIGCFLEGLADNTYGLPTSLPWGVDFGDGVRRHPTQLYEILWVSILMGWLLWFQKRPHRSGDLFKGYMVGYMGWRLLIDFLKPGIPLLGLTAIQWVCVATLLYYVKDLPYLFRIKEVPAYA